MVGSTFNACVNFAKDSMYIPHFNYIRGTSFFDCLWPLSSVLAWSSAKIHESHIGSWAHLSALDPARVQVVDSIVELKGPVWVVASTLWPLNIRCLLASLAVGIGTGLAAPLLDTILPPKKSTKDQVPTLNKALSVIAGIGAGVLVWKQLGKVIPATRGIFFYNLPI